MDSIFHWIPIRFQSKFVVPSRLRKFGFLLGGICLTLWTISYLRGHSPSMIWVESGLLLVLTAWIFPSALKGPFLLWMTLGHFLGELNSRIILSLIFFFLVTPIGLLMRVMRKDPLTLKWDSSLRSYKVKKIPRKRDHYERMF